MTFEMRTRLRLQFSILAVLPMLVAAAPVAEIAENVFLIRGDFPKDGQPDGNSVVVVTPDGAVVIDTGRHTVHTQKIVDFARSKGRTPVAVINTHWHLDHTGGNILLRQLFPNLRIYATDAGHDAQSGFLQNYRTQLESAVKTSKPGNDVSAWQAELGLIAAETQRSPDRIVDSSGDMTIAGRPFTLHRERGATAGDLWIEDRQSNLVMAGDLVTFPVPFFDTACPSDWAQSLDHIAATSFTTLIPGHGTPMNRAQFVAYRAAFTELLTCANSERPSADCIAEWSRFAKPLAEANEFDRIPSMLDYYFQSLLRAPPRVDRTIRD